MKQTISVTSRVVLLIVLVMCLYIKVVDAYSVFNQIEPTQIDLNNTIDKLEHRTKPITTAVAKTHSRVVSSNVLMVWKDDDGTVGSRSFDNDEFAILVTYAKTVGTNEFNNFMDSSKKMPTETLIAMAKTKLDNWYNLQASNDRG